MAYQRPFLISMKKIDPQQPWGFRTFGGKDYGEPHVVERVLEDSNAERGGLREGDEIIQIGRINVQDMSFGQVQEVLARCGSKIEMFIIREDLLSPRKGKEPPFVKAVVHNPYNSPLNLYSTENIADTLAKQTEVLTEGQISSAEEEEGPENLSFKQKSAVFQLLEEQAKQETVNLPSKGSPQRKAVPPPPPKPKPPAPVRNFQDKENFSPQETYQTQYYTKNVQAPRSTQALKDNYFSQSNSVDYQKSYQSSVNFSPTNAAAPITNGHLDFNYKSTDQRPVNKVGSTPPVQSNSPLLQETMSTTYRQQQQQPSYYDKQAQHYQQQQEINYQNQQQWQQHQALQQQPQRQPPPQHQYQSAQQQQSHESLQQQQRYQAAQHQQQHQTAPKPQQHQAAPKSQQQPAMQQQQVMQQQQQAVSQQYYQQQASRQQPTRTQPPQQQVEAIFESAPQAVGAPIVYKAPPSQKHNVNWPPQSPTQQNGRWNSPSPTPASPTRSGIDSMWPPRQSTVKDLPKTGFNPIVLRDQGTGRRCVWPPPKPDDEFRSGRTTPQSPVTGRRIIFNPSPSPPLSRKVPFGSMSPINRRKDIQWPPAQPVVTETYQQKPSPTLARRARFDDYVKQHAGCNVPTSYRPPPGTQHVEYC